MFHVLKEADGEAAVDDKAMHGDGKKKQKQKQKQSWRTGPTAAANRPPEVGRGVKYDD